MDGNGKPLTYTEVDGDYMGGLSKRDMFAMAALTGLVSDMDFDDRQDLANGITGGKFYAQAAYELADAMLRARQEKR